MIHQSISKSNKYTHDQINKYSRFPNMASLKTSQISANKTALSNKNLGAVVAWSIEHRTRCRKIASSVMSSAEDPPSTSGKRAR